MRICILLVLTPVVFGILDESKIKQFRWRGEFPVIDETVLSNPTSFDYDFSEDLRKSADVNDIYDQFVDQLPAYQKFKSGQNEGVTEVPIVTRRVATWKIATPEVDIEIIPVTTPLQPTTKETTTAMPTTTTERSTTTTVEEATTKQHFTEQIRSSAEDIHRETPEAMKLKPTPFRFRPTIESTTTAAPTTPPTTASTTTEATTRFIHTTTERAFFRMNVQEKQVPHQPPPVFKELSIRGPIWRKGGVVEFGGAPVVQQFNTVHQQTIRPHVRKQFFNGNFATVRGVFRQRFSTFAPATTTTTEAPTTTTQRVTVAPRRETFVHHNVAPLRTFNVRPADPLNRIIPKPVAIQHGKTRYRGPTYNCRVLNPFVDGRPSSEHDTSCVMAYPGLSADGTCRCFYKVSQRDENGCAMGYLFACKNIRNSSVRV